MAFEFDPEQAKRPVKVSWWLRASTVATLDEMARSLGAKIDDVAQQALDHALADRRRKKERRGRGAEAR